MKIVIGNSRWRAVLLLAACLAFVSGGIFVLVSQHTARYRSSDGTTAAWSSTIFFGLGGFAAIRRLIDSRPRLILDDEGVWDRTLDVGRIAWTDIEGAYLRSIRSNNFICLVLRDTDRYLSKTTAMKRALANANTALGFTPISLNLSGVAANAKDILEIIVTRIHAPTEDADFEKPMTGV